MDLDNKIFSKSVFIVETINLFHETDEVNWEYILEEGIQSPRSRSEAPDLLENEIRYNVVYLLDPELALYTSERWLYDDSVFVEVEVPADDLYIYTYGDSRVEKSHIDNIEEVATNYSEITDFEYSRPQMFITPDGVDSDIIRAAKW